MNLISFIQTANPLSTVGFSATVTRLTSSSPTSTSDGCSSGGSYVGGSPTGKIALVRRGTCFFNTKCYNAATAGAGVVVIYNNVAGNVTASINGTYPVTIPVITISATDGVLISTAINASSAALPTLTVINATYNC